MFILNPGLTLLPGISQRDEANTVGSFWTEKQGRPRRKINKLTDSPGLRVLGIVVIEDGTSNSFRGKQDRKSQNKRNNTRSVKK